MAHDILIVDDEKDIRDLLSGVLEDEGYTTRAAHDGMSALEMIQKRQPSLVVLDVWLGDSERDGLKILELIKRDHPYVPVLMISGHGTIATAVTAIKMGAYDFMEKPFQTEKLLILIDRAIESSMLKMENDSLRRKTGSLFALHGQTTQMTVVKNAIDRVASTNARVFLKGPAGSEKESIARYIHQSSHRSKGPFIAFNCTTVHPQFIEAELFGVDLQGQSSDQPRKIGIVEQCHAGTLFIDHIEDMPLPIQARFLKMIQENAFQRVGGADKISVDVRFVAASTKIEETLREGSFREDLFYRLAVSTLDIPSLAERIADLPYLLKFLMDEQAVVHGVMARKFSDEAMIMLQGYSWPGNVRQLKNMVDWILINSTQSSRDPVSVQELPSDILGTNNVSAVWNKSAEVVSLPLREARETFERDYLLAQVNRFGGNISQTARFIGMERSALHRKLRSLGLHEGGQEAASSHDDDLGDDVKSA